MLKQFVRRLLDNAGLQISTVERFGLEPELDLLRLAADRPIRVAFDVGANLGQTAMRFRMRFPIARIYCFEPIAQTFKSLVSEIGRDEKTTAFNIGIGESSGTMTIYTSDRSGTNSLTRTADSTGEATVVIDTIENFSAAQSISTIDILKIDVEGHELPVLRGSQKLIESGAIRFVLAECDFAVNPDTPHANFFELHRWLSDRGFCLVSFYPEAFSLKHGSCHGNALFALRSSLPAKVPGRVQNIY